MDSPKFNVDLYGKFLTVVKTAPLESCRQIWIHSICTLEEEDPTQFDPEPKTAQFLARIQRKKYKSNRNKLPKPFNRGNSEGYFCFYSTFQYKTKHRLL